MRLSHCFFCGLFVALLSFMTPNLWASDLESCVAFLSADQRAAYLNLPPHIRKSAEQLLEAQEKGFRVSIEEGGILGETVGRVSDVRIENGELKFRVEGTDYAPFYGITVKFLGAHSDLRARKAMVAALPQQLETIDKLLSAQERGLNVGIREGGVMGETTGRVSDVRVENGVLKFKIEGEEYDAFYGISVRILN